MAEVISYLYQYKSRTTFTEIIFWRKIKKPLTFSMRILNTMKNARHTIFKDGSGVILHLPAPPDHISPAPGRRKNNFPASGCFESGYWKMSFLLHLRKTGQP
jgi:hypothetical protein